MFKSSSKTGRDNRKVYNIKKREITKYKKELVSYTRSVSEIAFATLAGLGKTTHTGKLGEGKLGTLLANPPELGTLSLPAFLGQGSKIDKDDQELIDAKKGYIYISRDKETMTYTITFHMEKPDQFNPYLDAHKTFKQALPMIIRDNGIITTQLYSITKILNLFK